MYRICLVEDEISLNNILKSYIEKEGYEVIQFFNGNDAYNYIGKEEVDLWILDIMLGDNISGYDLIKKKSVNIIQILPLYSHQQGIKI